jgi:hypothetical protein
MRGSVHHRDDGLGSASSASRGNAANLHAVQPVSRRTFFRRRALRCDAAAGVIS